VQLRATRPISVSPVRLARIINRNKSQWDKHQVYEELDLQPVWSNLKIASDDLLQCQANCEARIYPVALTVRTGNVLLLKITNFYFSRYLLFRATRVRAGSQTAWRFLGYIDHAFNKYEMSWHRVIAQGNKHWLVIRGQTGSGTGFSSYDDTWYEVSKKGIREVLRYTARAHIAQWPKGIGWKLNSRIVSQDTRAGSVVVRFSVSFSGLNYMTERYPFLFSNWRAVRFRWDPAQRRFTFVNSVTAKSKDVFESVYQADHWSEEAFVKFNLSELLGIVKGRNSMQREWLRDFVSGYKDSPEKKRLLRAFR
jgi:hypothetical protein